MILVQSLWNTNDRNGFQSLRMFVMFQYRELHHLDLYCTLIVEARLKSNIHFDCRYLELWNVSIISLVFNVLYVRDWIESKYPSIIFLSILYILYCGQYFSLSYDVASGNEIRSCNKIGKPLVVYRFTGNVMTNDIHENLCKTVTLINRKLFFKTNYRLMQVKSITEFSPLSILQCFWPSLSYHLSFLVRSSFCLSLSGSFTQVLL